MSAWLSFPGHPFPLVSDDNGNAISACAGSAMVGRLIQVSAGGSEPAGSVGGGIPIAPAPVMPTPGELSETWVAPAMSGRCGFPPLPPDCHRVETWADKPLGHTLVYVKASVRQTTENDRGRA